MIRVSPRAFIGGSRSIGPRAVAGALGVEADGQILVIAQLPSQVCDGYDLEGDGPWSGSDIAVVGQQADRLKRAKPRYRHLATDRPDAFVAAIASDLEIDVIYQSDGPTRADKR